jgi:hypothetical protein
MDFSTSIEFAILSKKLVICVKAGISQKLVRGRRSYAPALQTNVHLLSQTNLGGPHQVLYIVRRMGFPGILQTGSRLLSRSK